MKEIGVILWKNRHVYTLETLLWWPNYDSTQDKTKRNKYKFWHRGFNSSTKEIKLCGKMINGSCLQEAYNVGTSGRDKQWISKLIKWLQVIIKAVKDSMVC